MRRTRYRGPALVLALALVMAACGDGAGDTTTTTTTADITTPDETTTTAGPETTTTEGAPTAELLVWTDESRAPVVNQIAPAFTDATGVTVQVEILEFGQIRDQVGVAGPAGEGPDLFVGAHDWVGQLVVDGAIDPIDLGGKAADFFDVALSAFTFEGDVYAVPYATEAVALYYNPELAADAPETWDDLVAACEAAGDIENCVGVTGGGPDPDAYHNYPFVSAFGGYIFAYSDETGFDPTDVGLDNDETIAGVEFLGDQVAAGIIDPLDYDGAKNLFLAGSQPFWITGPWEVGALREQTDVEWAVTTIPRIGDDPIQPFVGAQGFFLSSFSANKVVAQSFLLDFIATEEGMQALYEADPRNPAYQPVFEAVADDPVVEAFGLSAADGVPMPNIPQMAAVWEPLGNALLLVRTGELGAEEAMTTAAAAVREAVEG